MSNNYKVLGKYKTPGAAPWRAAYHLTYTLNDFYLIFKKEFPNMLTKKEYVDMAAQFFGEVRKEIVHNRYWFKMPFQLGTIRIKKRKNSTSLNAHKLNWVETKKAKKAIYHLNLHTGRYYFRWKWTRPRSGKQVTNSLYYGFKPLRVSKQFLKNHIMECNTDPGLRDYDCLI